MRRLSNVSAILELDEILRMLEDVSQRSWGDVAVVHLKLSQCKHATLL